MTVVNKSQKLAVEIGVRLFLFVFFYISDDATPYFRKIQPEEFWLYRFPRTPSFYPGYLLWITILGVPTIVATVYFIKHRDKTDWQQAILGVVLSIYLTASVTNCIKLAVGRPRPDFLERCFPDVAFSSFGYVALYIAGKCQCFTLKGRGHAYKLCMVFIPLVWATLIAASRTADFHHHWQDVIVGSILGLVISYLCYRQYYPSVYRSNCHIPYISDNTSRDIELQLIKDHINIP
ncbi:Hypothetical predicted protein [Mytilus galloprovincialis]|uniref:Phosphatidic acid phosphatase type 2/haloperoxidase domain-containing protein n=1 Tax=Mytilus galloprovincialis TaxID=29158 RepID=A0A8B6GQL5_MYTGA|nr:Hypothetical predicted protein [Mytilus galloprovincialis]